MGRPGPAHAWRAGRAAAVLRAGGVIAYPTEAVYGLGCDPFNARAFAALLRVKRRPLAKGVILIAASAGQVLPLAGALPSDRWDVVLDSWPGPVTWLLPARRGLPSHLTGGRDTIAVRVTAHPVAAAICAAFGGAVVSTSANRSGAPPLLTSIEVRRKLGAELDLVVPGRVGGLRSPTPIRDAMTGALRRAPGPRPAARAA